MESPNVWCLCPFFLAMTLVFTSRILTFSREPLHINGLMPLVEHGPFHQLQFPLFYSCPFHQYALPPLIADAFLSLLSGLLCQKLVLLLISVVTVCISLSLSFPLPLKKNFSGLSILFGVFFFVFFSQFDPWHYVGILLIW